MCTSASSFDGALSTRTLPGALFFSFFKRRYFWHQPPREKMSPGHYYFFGDAKKKGGPCNISKGEAGCVLRSPPLLPTPVKVSQKLFASRCTPFWHICTVLCTRGPKKRVEEVKPQRISPQSFFPLEDRLAWDTLHRFNVFLLIPSLASFKAPPPSSLMHFRANG